MSELVKVGVGVTFSVVTIVALLGAIAVARWPVQIQRFVAACEAELERREKLERHRPGLWQEQADGSIKRLR